jgi:hypothetical protein
MSMNPFQADGPEQPGKPKQTPPARIALWVMGGGVGLYLVITGIQGILDKG